MTDNTAAIRALLKTGSPGGSDPKHDMRTLAEALRLKFAEVPMLIEGVTIRSNANSYTRATLDTLAALWPMIEAELDKFTALADFATVIEPSYIFQITNGALWDELAFAHRIIDPLKAMQGRVAEAREIEQTEAPMMDLRNQLVSLDRMNLGGIEMQRNAPCPRATGTQAGNAPAAADDVAAIMAEL